MNTSIFEVLGPVMIGPSSSHTAGAARLARVARRIAARPFHHVSFGLHGSFAKTAKGHGTDKALVAGVLGLRESDPRLVSSFAMAAEQGLGYDFCEVEMEGVHDNTVHMLFSMDDGKRCEVVGSSIGGGRIRVVRVNGYETDFSAEACTLFIRQRDVRGVVSRVTRVLADNGINIGVMRLSRKQKGQNAFCVIETDDPLSEEVVRSIEALPDIASAQAINLED